MNKHLQLSIIAGIFGLLSVYGFNCAQQGMHGAGFTEESSVSGSSIGGGGGIGGGGSASGTPFSEAAADPTKNLPVALNNGEQMFKSMLNVTGQATPTAAQVTEFNLVSGTLSENSLLSSINSPLLLNSTSLAGEVCFGLVNKEAGQAANQRMYFDAVNFAAGPQNTNGAFMASVQKMSRGFLGRDIASDESAMLNTFYTDFLAGAANNTAQTLNLYTAACAALLSSFDAVTF